MDAPVGGDCGGMTAENGTSTLEAGSTRETNSCVPDTETEPERAVSDNDGWQCWPCGAAVTLDGCARLGHGNAAIVPRPYALVAGRFQQAQPRRQSIKWPPPRVERRLATCLEHTTVVEFRGDVDHQQPQKICGPKYKANSPQNSCACSVLTNGVCCVGAVLSV